MPDCILETWTHAPTSDLVAVVLPDGCRDLIQCSDAAGRERWLVSPLADTAQAIACRAGERFRGFRFMPGAEFDAQALTHIVSGKDDECIVEALADLVRVDPRVTEALACLSETASVGAAARMAGLGERSLERLVVAGTGRTPRYWRCLARVRRAAAALAEDLPLAAVAADYLYADQAHMTRDFRQWFTVTPAAFRADPALIATVTQSGYG